MGNLFFDKKIKLFLGGAIFILLLAIIFLPSIVKAEDWLKGLRDVGVAADYPSFGDDPIIYIIDVINYLLNFIGVIFLLIVVYGGLMWMTARGNEEKIKKAKELIKTAFIGLLIIIFSRVFYYFVYKTINPLSSGHN